MDNEYRKEWNAELREVTKAYKEYVKACHSKIGVFTTEYSFKEWLAAGKPKGLD
jgi:hypothetical protein